MKGIAKGLGRAVERRPQKCPFKLKIYIMYQPNVKNYAKL